MTSNPTAGERKLRMGLIGVGHGGSELIATFEQSPLVELVAAADINPDRLQALRQEMPDVRTYDSAEKLCADADVEAVWIATPHNMHCEHTLVGARHGKHLICYQPMGISFKEAAAMAEAADKNNVTLLIGGMLSFSGHIRAIRRLIVSGELGPLRAIHSLAYTDWMLAPRLPEESDHKLGGGVVFSMASHQLDVVRLLGGGRLRSIRGYVGQWSSVRPCTGYCSASFEFEDGAVGSITYNSYGYFMGSELVPWGHTRGLQNSTPESRAEVRKGLLDGTSVEKEQARKQTVRLGAAGQAFMHEQRSTERKPWVPLHLGMLVATCERGDIRQSADGLYVYDDDGNREVPVDDYIFRVGRSELQEFYDAVVLGWPLYHDAAWSLGTAEAQMALVQSAEEHREIKLSHQVAMPSNAYAP